MKLRPFCALFLAILLAPTMELAHANSVGGSDQCPEQAAEQKPKDKVKQQSNILEMAAKLLLFVQQKNASVALVSRAGSDLADRTFFENGTATPHKFTHMGIMYKTNEGAWRFIHLLNTCAGPSSDIFEQKLPEFFTDDPYLYDVSVVIPSPDLQRKMLDVINDRSVAPKGWARAVHHPVYSNIANPFNTKYQNSNMWVLSVIAAAQSGLKSREAVQNYYKQSGFVPTQAKLATWEVMFGGLKSNVAISDHTGEEISSSRLNFVSAISVERYISRTDHPMVSQYELCPNAGCNKPVELLEKP